MNTSPTMRPPTGPSVPPILAEDARLAQDVEPERRRLIEVEPVAAQLPQNLVVVATSTGARMSRAMLWPDGMPQVTWRRRLRDGSDTGVAGHAAGDGLAIGQAGAAASEIVVSISLFGRIAGLVLPGPP